MNASMKKQILLILGLACLMQSELFAMKKMTSVERQAAIKQAINKKDYAKASDLAQGLKEPNKSLVQSRIDKLQNDVVRGAPAQVLNQDQQAVADAVVMPDRQAQQAMQQDLGMQGQAQGAGRMAPADIYKNFKDIQKVCNEFIELSNFNMSLAKFAALPQKFMSNNNNMDPLVQDFKAKLEAVLVARGNNSRDKNPEIDAIQLAFAAGKTLFYRELNTLYALPKASLEQVYTSITGLRLPEEDNVKNGISNLNVIRGVIVRDLRANLMNEIMPWYDSSLLEILAPMIILTHLIQVDCHDAAARAKMEVELREMQIIAAATHTLIGFKLIGEKPRETWTPRGSAIEKIFLGPDQDYNITNLKAMPNYNSVPQSIKDLVVQYEAGVLV
jgi:hypothetical protein